MLALVEPGGNGGQSLCSEHVAHSQSETGIAVLAPFASPLSGPTTFCQGRQVGFAAVVHAETLRRHKAQ